jgi:hypothetical protein
MVELVDSEDLGSSAVRRVGSSPTTRTINEPPDDILSVWWFVFHTMNLLR